MTSASTIWGIDRRFVVAALILVVFVVPVFPRQKVIHVSATTVVTVTQTSYTYLTSYQSHTSEQQKQIQVYVGWLQIGSGGSYCYWDYYYGWVCPYGYYQQSQKTTLDPTDHIVKVDYTNEAGGTYTVTMYTYEGQQRVFRNVSSYDLTLSGTATITAMVTVTDTLVNTQAIPNPVVQQQDTSHDEVVTERVSILQLLLGF